VVTAHGASIAEAAPFAGGCLADVPSRLAKPACCRLGVVLWRPERAKHNRLCTVAMFVVAGLLAIVFIVGMER
jgi:hypothetical protein